MVTRVFSSWMAAAVWAGVFIASVQVPGVAEAGNKACGLLTASELESTLGVTVSMSGSGSSEVGSAELCTGETPTVTVLLRLAKRTTGTSGDAKAGIEAARTMGAQVDVKIFGPISCSTVVPPASLAQYGFNTTCTVSKSSAVAGVEVVTKTQEDMLSIEQLRPLAEKMVNRF